MQCRTLRLASASTCISTLFHDLFAGCFGLVRSLCRFFDIILRDLQHPADNTTKTRKDSHGSHSGKAHGIVLGSRRAFTSSASGSQCPSVPGAPGRRHRHLLQQRPLLAIIVPCFPLIARGCAMDEEGARQNGVVRARGWSSTSHGVRTTSGSHLGIRDFDRRRVNARLLQRGFERLRRLRSLEAASMQILCSLEAVLRQRVADS